jgi:NTE family protein
MEAVRASSGLPGLFTPDWHQGRWLIDGGVVNPVPVSPCRAMGADIVIAVDLSRPTTRAGQRVPQQPLTQSAEASGNDSSAAGDIEPGNAILSRWSGKLDGLVESFRTRRSEPGLIEVMSSAVGIMQDRITRNRLDADPPDAVLRPDLADFQLMDFHRAAEAIDRGMAYVADNSPLLQPIRLALGEDLAGSEPTTRS